MASTPKDTIKQIEYYATALKAPAWPLITPIVTNLTSRGSHRSAATSTTVDVCTEPRFRRSRLRDVQRPTRLGGRVRRCP
jgi:hypothetical protein